MINKEQVRTIISEYQKSISNIELIPRDYTLDDGLNYVFVGIRRAGKSFLMYQQAKHLLENGHHTEEILYFNFEDDRLGEIALSDLDIIKTTYEETFSQKPIFFLDEIQNIPHWEKFVRRLADQKYRVYVTGSNAKMLSREVATTLGGRFIIQEVFPFSFREYLKLKGHNLSDKMLFHHSRSMIVREFDAYFRLGGLPEVLFAQDKRAWLSSLYNKIFFGDIVTRHSIRNDYALRVLVKKLAESLRQPSSYNRLANIVSASGKKASTDTIIDYVGYLQESWLIFAVSNFCDVLAERETIKKYYFIDNGILNLFLLDPDTSLLENFVAVTLRCRYGEGIYHYKKNIEVDFYVPDEELAVQACMSLNDDATRMREVGALMALAKHFPVRKAFIITKDEESTLHENGLDISVVPVWKWVMMGQNF